MQELEDEPEDVQNASPVEDEVKTAEIDELSTKSARKMDYSTKSKSKESLYPRHRCPKEEPKIPKLDCCEAKRQRAAATQNMLTMYVHEEPCKLAKQERVPRHCLTKEEYIDFLAEPKKKCPMPCGMKRVLRKARVISPRIIELSKPTKRRLMLTLLEQGMNMSPEQLYNIIELLEGETAFTPEQAENFVRDKAELAKSMKKKKKKKEKTKCQSKAKQIFGAGEPSLDLEAANCQYSMAQRFVRSIFNYKCMLPREDYRDIADILLCRLSKLLEYTPIGNEDRKSQQMRILADIVACWITEVLVQVSDRYKDDLEEECCRKRREIEDLASREALEAMEDDDFDKDCDQDEVELDDEEANKNETTDTASLIVVCDIGAQGDAGRKASSSSQYEDPDCTDGDTSSRCFKVELDDTGELDDGDDGKSIMVLDEGKDVATQTDRQCRKTAETTTKKDGECDEDDIECLKNLHGIASRMSSAFSDIPFITFSKIFETLYCMIECEFENTLEDPMDNRIHRAIYEKFEKAIKKEDPELLTERIKDITDVISGKIARWLRYTLSEKQINFLCDNPAEVESREVRDWSKWVANVADIADDWSSWINRVTAEANCMNKTGQMTRGEWQDWTGKFEKNAMLWRRTYLEAIHQQHHNTMMMADRKVTKTGTRKKPQFSERTIKYTNFDSVSRLKDD